MDVGPVNNRTSAAALTASVLTSVVAFSLVVLVPIFAQGVQGCSAVVTGLALLPHGLAVGLVIQPLLSGWLSPVASEVTTDRTAILTTVERIGGAIGTGSVVSLHDDVLTRPGPTAAIRTVIAVLGALTVLVLALTPTLPSGRAVAIPPAREPPSQPPIPAPHRNT